MSLNEMLQQLLKTYIKEATFLVGVGDLEAVHATNTCFFKIQSICLKIQCLHDELTDP